MPKAPPPGTTTLDDPSTRARGGSGRGRGRGGRGRGTSSGGRGGSARSGSTASFDAGRGSGGGKRKKQGIESLDFDTSARRDYLTAQPRAGVERRKKSAAKREAREKEARRALRREGREEKRKRVKEAMARYEAVLDPDAARTANGDGDDADGNDEWHGFDEDDTVDATGRTRSGRPAETTQQYTVQRQGIDGEDEGEDQVTVTVTEL